MRAVGEPNRTLEGRTLLVAASYVVLRRGDEVLLQLRRGTGYMDGFWATMAGHVDPGESVYDAAVRELKEEADVAVLASDLQPLTTIHRYEPDGPQVEQRCDVFFETRTWTGEARIAEPAKCEAMTWFPLAALPEPVVPHELLVLQTLAAHGALPAVVALRTAPAGTTSTHR